ncbi:YcbK family protein [Microvirga pakistanensis]|uniref:YcbK family protein n=1 Tax=Microvirga pakistanensis TaxID=1682650 RepID=UPI00106A1386|nr:D-Ala-D-Ala carboxypeptidase family metallohydrolase [Microvirga pakistanensis]
MSTELKVRCAPWLAFTTGTCLAALVGHPAHAQSPHAEQNGIVIPISFPKAAPLLPSRPPSKVRAKARAVPTTLPKVEYTSLPSGDRITDPATTGSLPDAGTLGTRGPAGFTSLVSRGTIKLRAAAPTQCLPGNLLAVIADVAEKFGPVSIESTHRSKSRNWRAGGARHSLHLSCRALDFRVKARARGIMAYLGSRPEVGGLKMYRNGIIHIDNGERRSW